MAKAIQNTVACGSLALCATLLAVWITTDQAVASQDGNPGTDPSSTQDKGPDPAAYIPKEEWVAQWNPGDRWVQRWSASHQLKTTLLTMQVDDQDLMDLEARPEMNSRETRFARDWIQEVEGGSLTRARRIWTKSELYGKLALPGSNLPPTDVTLKSPLAGKGVSIQFVADPDLGGYGRHFDRNATPESLLARQNLGLDFSQWLPAPGAGRTWSVPISALKDLVAPGGKMAYSPTAEGGEIVVRNLMVGLGGDWDDLMDGPGLKGSVTCWVDKIEDLGQGIRNAHIAVEFAVENELDRSDVANRYRLGKERQMGMVVERATLKFRAQGAARLIWSLDQRRLRSYDLQGREVFDFFLRSSDVEGVGVNSTLQLQGPFRFENFVLPAPAGKEPMAWTTQPDKEEGPGGNGTSEDKSGSESGD